MPAVWTTPDICLRYVVASVLVAMGLSTSTSAQQASVPFTICSESFEWTRPSPQVQSKIWNDNRYKGLGPSVYEWTHDCLLNEPDSASITYHSENLSGLWTAGARTQCQRHDDGPHDWIELWSLNHHVFSITIDGEVITISTERREKGFEILQCQRPGSLGSAHATIRFVTDQGEVLGQLGEREPAFFPHPRQ